MNNLFIIGNGFDIDHGLNTTYNHFREYLIAYAEKYSYQDYNYTLPDFTFMPDGSEEIDDKEVVAFLVSILEKSNGENWGDLESSLASLDFYDYFSTPLLDKEGDVNYWHTSYQNSDVASILVRHLQEIPKFFSQWIYNTKPIKQLKVKKRFLNLLRDNQNFFINFNYTSTLQDIYGVQEVCHIHGKIGEVLYFGHGDKEEKFDSYQVSLIGAENELDSLHKLLKKDTKRALENHYNFFLNLPSDLDSIYSYGFSFSIVDLVYIKEIFLRIDSSNITWYFNDYSRPNVISRFKEKLQELGFKGKFSLFKIRNRKRP